MCKHVYKYSSASDVSEREREKEKERDVSDGDELMTTISIVESSVAGW